MPICRLNGSQHKASAIGEIGQFLAEPQPACSTRRDAAASKRRSESKRKTRTTRAGVWTGRDPAPETSLCARGPRSGRCSCATSAGPPWAPTMDRRSLTRPRGALVRGPLARTIARPDAHLATGRDVAVFAQEPCFAPPAGIASGGSGSKARASPQAASSIHAERRSLVVS